MLYFALLQPNASLQLLPEAGAQRTLEAVSCKALILIEASPLSIPQWYAGSGKNRLPMKEETFYVDADVKLFLSSLWPRRSLLLSIPNDLSGLRLC
jgi:hypothetical protein